MTVGNQATVASISNSLTQLALNIRNDCQSIQNFQQFVVTLGSSGLETLGFDSTDAGTVITMASYLSTVAQVYLGLFGQGPSGSTAADFDFNNALSGLTAGQ